MMLWLMLLFGQSMNMNQQPIIVKDEGVQQSPVRATVINCTGTGVTCSQSGTTMTLNATGGGGGAPIDATYITQTANATLTNEQALSSLSTGVVKVTNGTGALSTAVSGTDYAPPTSGTALQAGNGSGGFSAYAGTSCTNQFPRSLSAAGAATCASVALGSDVAGTLAQGNGGTGAGALTCTSGQALTSNGTAQSCTSTLTASDLACAGTCVADAEIAGMAASKLSSTVAAANGGFGGVQPTCGGGQYVTCNGSTCSCSTPAGGSGTSPLILAFGAF